MKSSSNLYSPQWVSTDQLPKDLYSEILPNLFMGGTHDDDVVFNSQENEHKITEQEFDAVVTMYSWAHPTDWGVQEMRYGIPDSEIKHINLEKLFEVAYWGFNRWLAGDRVLVRCQAGLNRSGLITCLILMLKGYSQEQAINLIREKRSQVALFNHNYISWLNMEAFDKLNTFLGSKSADMLDPNSKNLG